MASFEFDQHLPISAASVQLMVQLAARRGWSADGCLAGSGIDPGVLDDPFAEITARQEFDVMRNLDELRCGEPGFWVEVGTNYHAGMHGSWGMALLTSRSLRDVIELTAEFVELAWVFTTITVTEYVDTDEVGIYIDDGDLPPDIASILVERISAAITSILRDLTNTDVAGVLGALPALRAIEHRPLRRRVRNRTGFRCRSQRVGRRLGLARYSLAAGQ